MSPSLRDGPLVLDGHTVEISNSAKVFFPDAGITKGEVVGYYRDVAPVMLQHLRGRPLSLQRYPNGIEGIGFFQKDASEHFPSWIRAVPMERRRDGGSVAHVVSDEAAALVYLANQAAITFHAPTVRAERMDHPDLVIFDLDPVAGSPLEAVRAAARELRAVLGAIGLVPFLQTSGSKGYHVVAPLEPVADYEEVRALSREVAGVVAARDATRWTVEQRIAKRHGRVFIDTYRNGYAQTTVVPYSVRARPGAPVATPIEWRELARTAPQAYGVRNIRRRLAQRVDPWAAISDSARPATAARAALRALTGAGLGAEAAAAT